MIGHLRGRLLSQDPDRVVVETPTFPPLLDMLELAGADIVGVPVDAEGLEPGGLADALAEPTRAIFVQPRAHNPTGAAFTTARAPRRWPGRACGPRRCRTHAPRRRPSRS